MATAAKQRFLETLEQVVLRPRGMHCKVQFTGPTGTNAVEAALKLARRMTGRQNVVAFTNAFHGMSLGAVAATGKRYYRKASGVALSQVSFMPYDGYHGPEIDTITQFECLLDDTGSGLDHPAAVLVETIQGEGGINVASVTWLRCAGGMTSRWAAGARAPSSASRRRASHRTWSRCRSRSAALECRCRWCWFPLSLRVVKGY